MNMAIPIDYLAEAYKDSLTKPDEIYAQQVLRRLTVIALLSELKPIHEYVAECESPQMWFDPQTVADDTGLDVGWVERGMKQIYKYGLFVRKPTDVEGFAWVYQTDVEFRRNVDIHDISQPMNCLNCGKNAPLPDDDLCEYCRNEIYPHLGGQDDQSTD